MAKKGEKTQMLDDAINGVQRAIDSQFKSARALAEASGINAPNLTRWLSGAQNPDFNNFSLVLMRIGARLVFPDEQIMTSKQNYVASAYDTALLEILGALLPVHNLNIKKVALALGPEETKNIEKVAAILAGKLPLTPEIFFQLCQLMDEDPSKLMRLAQERIEEEHNLTLPLRKAG